MGFPSSSDKSLSDSARMSSMLESKGQKVFREETDKSIRKGRDLCAEQPSTFHSLF